MGEIVITEEELDYLTDVPYMVCEKTGFYRSQASFEEESKTVLPLKSFQNYGKRSEGTHFRRAVPYAIDLKGFQP